MTLQLSEHLRAQRKRSPFISRIWTQAAEPKRSKRADRRSRSGAARGSSGIRISLPRRSFRPCSSIGPSWSASRCSDTTKAPKFATFVTAAVEDQAANAHCSQIFDERQTASTRSAPSVICRSPPARTAELSATPWRVTDKCGSGSSTRVAGCRRASARHAPHRTLGRVPL